MQLIDVKSNGKTWMVGQRSDSDQVWNRIRARAQTALSVEVLRHNPVVPTPPPTSPYLQSQRVVFMAEVTNEAIAGALASNMTWKFAVTADPGYWSTNVKRLIDGLKEQGRPPSPWCDCRPASGTPAGTPFPVAKNMQEAYGLSTPIGQAESVQEYLHAIRYGAKIIIGNPAQLATDSAILKDAIERCNEHELEFIGEVLHPDGGYSAQGIPISSGCFYNGLDGGVYQPTSAFEAVMPGYMPTRCHYHGAMMRPADWALTR